MAKDNNSEPDPNLKLEPIHEPRYDPSETFLTLEELENTATAEKSSS